MADKLNPRRLTRTQLAAFLPSHEHIKFFEALTEVTGSSADEIDLLTILTDLAQQSADTTSAQQNAQAAQLDRIASALELLALAPASEPLPAPEQHVCETCAATREELAALVRRVADLESAP